MQRGSGCLTGARAALFDAMPGAAANSGYQKEDAEWMR